MKISFQDGLICAQEGFESLTREKLEQHQLDLINLQLRRARAKGGFYEGCPEKLDTLADLARLPFLDAEGLRQNFAGLCLSPNDQLIRLRTSGTTGQPKRVAYTEYDCSRTREFFTVGLTELIEPGDRVFAAFPNTDRNSLGGLLNDAVTAIGASIVHMTGRESYRQLAAMVTEHNCNVYLGAPVLLLSLLRLLGSASPLKRALVSGDVCSAQVQAECQERLGSQLFPHYGLRESGLGGAMSCSAHEGMHIRENDLLFEVIDPDGGLLPDGQWGELVLTSFGLEGMPLFRYRTGDRGRILPEPCPCGSIVKRLEVSGRLGCEDGPDQRALQPREVIDACIAGEELRVLVAEKPEKIRQQLQGLFPGKRISVSPLGNEDGPYFKGKRNNGRMRPGGE